MRRTTVLALAVLCAALSAGGCWFRGPGGVRRDVEQMAGLELDSQFGIRVGPLGMSLVRTGLRIAGQADEIPVRGVRHVAVGVYEVRGAQPARGAAGRPLCRADLPGWQLAVRICDPEESVLLFVREQEQSIRGLLVVVQEEDEVVIVRARGRLERLLADVTAMARDEAGGPWSASAPAREDRQAGPTPWVAVCAADGGSPAGCADREQARTRVIEVARRVAPGDAALP